MSTSQDIIRKRAIEILAEHGAECDVSQLEELIDNPNAVLKISYCLDAIEASIEDSCNRIVGFAEWTAKNADLLLNGNWKHKGSSFTTKELLELYTEELKNKA